MGDGEGPGGAWVARAAWIAVVAALVPIVTAAGRALVQGWVPLGDDAYFTVRSRDVLGPDHPWLGAWSSGSSTLQTSVNNLGPLQLDLLAPFTAVEWTTGTAVGTAAVNLLAVVGVALVARRLVAPSGVVLVMAGVALVTWAMGSEVIISPRQHHALILPFLFFLVLCWGLVAGDRWLLPWAALVASLLVQTHLSYLVLVPVLAAWGVGALVLRHARDGGADEGGWSALRRPAAATVAVLVVVWAQTAADQLFRTGNLGKLLQAGSGEEGTSPGLTRGAAIVAEVVARPVGWTRWGFRDFTPLDATSGWAALVAAAVVAGLVGATLVGHDRTVRAAGATAAVAVAAGVLAAGVTPAGSLGPVAGNYRWLWPVAAFALVAVGLLLLDGRGSGGDAGASRDAGRLRVRATTGVALVVVAVLTVAAVPLGDDLEYVRSDERLRPVAVDLVRQLEEADLDGPVVFDRTGATPFEPYTYVVLAALQDTGVAFTFDNPTDVRRFGQGRRDRGRAEVRLVLVTGPGARSRPQGERVALASSLSAADLERQSALVDRVGDAVADGSLTPADGTDEATPALDALRSGEAPRPDDVTAEIVRLVAVDGLRGDAGDLDRARDLAALREEERLGTVALYLDPSG